MFTLTFARPGRTPAAITVQAEQAGSITKHYTITLDNMSTLVPALLEQGYTVTIDPIFTNNCESTNVNPILSGTVCRNL